jgi:hypothetical protein
VRLTLGLAHVDTLLSMPTPNSAPPPSIYKRVTASVPLLVTVIVHVVLVAIAGYFVVSEQIIGKRREFTAAPPAGTSIAQKQVEHRLQVARKSGGSASPSPVSASRIFSTAENALQLPAMPELPSVGASSLGGMGFGAGMGAVGTGTGYGTGLGTSAAICRGFMSMSFLGVTSHRSSKVVFIVDVGRDLLDIRKGGFEAFRIIREEIMKLISRLPPGAEFSVVLYERGRWNNNTVVAFSPVLVPATVANKEGFFAWIRPVNATPEAIGITSAEGRQVSWKPKDLEAAGIDGGLNLPDWAEALRFALEMEPETVFIISGSQGGLSRHVSETELARRKRDYEKRLVDMKRDGIDLAAADAARSRALGKARADLNAVNAKLRAQGKPPFIVTSVHRIFQADFQTALKRAGYSIALDKTGWTDKQGQLIWGVSYSTTEGAEFHELIMHVAKLQRALVRDRAAINYFLFVGPDENPTSAVENLSKLADRNGGKFELLTTKRLQEITAREEAK